MSKRNSLLLLGLLLVVLAMLVACAPAPAPAEEPAAEEPAAEEPAAEEPTEAPAEPTEEMMTYEGDILVDGSSTVFPLMTATAEDFQAANPDVRISVGLAGTGGGFSVFCPGETDMSNASRPIRTSEAAACETNGVQFVEFLLAYDGLTVVAHPDNPIECISQAQLASIFTADEANSVTTWGDVDPAAAALGDIVLFIPDPDSGTRDFMIEVVDGILDIEDVDLRSDDTVTVSSDDNVLLTGVGGTENAIGFFGFSYYVNNQDAVKAIAIENGDGECVVPSNETVQDGSYNPLSRPLFTYANVESLRNGPQVVGFIEYMMNGGLESVMEEVGYSLPPEGTYEANLEALKLALTTDFGAFEGDILADGSSTVFPLATAVAEEFQAVAPGVRASIGLAGTGGGFSVFCPGETDLSNASRAIREAEAEACATNGVEFVEFLVAYDGLTVVAHPDNPIECISQAQLAAIFTADEANSVTTWGDVDPAAAALGDIVMFIPDPDSGTRDFMIEVVNGILDIEDVDLRSDDTVTVSSDDNVLLTGVGGTENATGFFGFAYYVNNQDAVKAIAIENGDGECVVPSDETVQNGSYNPLSRPLYVYANAASLAEKPAVAAYLTYWFLGGGQAVMSEVGYSMPPAGTYSKNLTKLAWAISAGM